MPLSCSPLSWALSWALDLFAEQGVFGQLTLHSHTSQYGQLRALLADNRTEFRDLFTRVLHDDILSRAFARKWSDVQAQGGERLEQLRAAALNSAFARAEATIIQQVKQPLNKAT